MGPAKDVGGDGRPRNENSGGALGRVGDEPSRADRKHRCTGQGVTGRRRIGKPKTIHLIGQLFLERSSLFNSPEAPLRRLAPASPENVSQYLSSSACRCIVGLRAVRGP